MQESNNYQNAGFGSQNRSGGARKRAGTTGTGNRRGQAGPGCGNRPVQCRGTKQRFRDRGIFQQQFGAGEDQAASNQSKLDRILEKIDSLLSSYKT